MPRNDRTFFKDYPGRIQRRGTEPPEHIWLPTIGLVAHARIDCFVADRQYCWVYLKGEKHPKLLTEPLGYFQKQLPGFVRANRYKLRNPDQSYLKPLLQCGTV